MTVRPVRFLEVKSLTLFIKRLLARTFRLIRKVYFFSTSQSKLPSASLTIKMSSSSPEVLLIKTSRPRLSYTPPSVRRRGWENCATSQDRTSFETVIGGNRGGNAEDAA